MSSGTRRSEGEAATSAPMREPASVPVDRPPSASSADLVVRLVDEAGSVLPQAKAWVREASAAWRALTLGERGLVASPPFSPESPRVELLARCPGFLPLEVQVASRGESELVLARAHAISGVVVDSGGTPVADRPLVLAHPEGCPPGKVELLAAVQGQPTALLTARAEEDGSFIVDGVAPDRSYTLLAAGNGVASKEPLRNVVAGARDASVQVQALFGLRLRLPYGVGSRSSWVAPGPQWFWDREAGFSGIGTDGLLGILAGLPMNETSRIAHDTLVLMFVGSPHLGAVGPVRFSGTLVGYEPVEEALMIPRMTEPCAERELAPRPVAAEWGALQVEFTGLPVDYAPPDRVRPFGEIRFDSIDGGFSFVQSLSDFESLRLERVPAGTYALALSTEAGYAHFPATPERIAIAPDTIATASFDLGESCSIEVLVLDVEGREHAGETSFKVEHLTDEGARGAFASFQRPPYRIDGLVPGLYRLRIYKPFPLTEPLSVETRAVDRASTAVFQQI